MVPTIGAGEFNASIRFFLSCLVGEIIAFLLQCSRRNGLDGRLGPKCGSVVRSFLFDEYQR